MARYQVFRRDEMEFTPPSKGDQSRRLQRLSPALTTTRANVWWMPPGSRGRRHRETDQEELFVALEGTAMLLLGEPPEKVEVPGLDRSWSCPVGTAGSSWSTRQTRIHWPSDRGQLPPPQDTRGVPSGRRGTRVNSELTVKLLNPGLARPLHHDRTCPPARRWRPSRPARSASAAVHYEMRSIKRKEGAIVCRKLWPG